MWSLLALMMSDRLEAYPSKQMMSRHLDDLYGMVIGAQTIGYGRSQVLELRMKMMHPCFAHDSEEYLAEGIAFLREMITRPLNVCRRQSGSCTQSSSACGMTHRSMLSRRD